jgi:hypothetical protein
MIISAIFIETFFSTCGACALADPVAANESTAAARKLPKNDMVYSLSERSIWQDLWLEHYNDPDIQPPSGRDDQPYLENTTVVQSGGLSRVRCWHKADIEDYSPLRSRALLDRGPTAA